MRNPLLLVLLVLAASFSLAQSDPFAKDRVGASLGFAPPELSTVGRSLAASFSLAQSAPFAKGRVGVSLDFAPSELSTVGRPLAASYSLAQSAPFAKNRVSVSLDSAPPGLSTVGRSTDIWASSSGVVLYASEPAAEPYLEPGIALVPARPSNEHTRFFDKKNLMLLGLNAMAQAGALFAIQSHGGGPDGWAQSQGRTLDLFEKHFEWLGYGWGAAYRFGGLVGLGTLAAYLAHKTGNHKLERELPYIAIGHAAASTGYALTGSKQGNSGW